MESLVYKVKKIGKKRKPGEKPGKLRKPMGWLFEGIEETKIANMPKEPSKKNDAITEQEPTRRKTTSFAPGEPPYSVFGGPSDDATLRLIRNTLGGVFVPFIVEVDGFFVGELAFGATLDVQLLPGDHIVAVSGGGAFVGATARFSAQENEVLAYTVCYSWYGGVKLSRAASD